MRCKLKELAVRHNAIGEEAKEALEAAGCEGWWVVCSVRVVGARHESQPFDLVLHT